MEILLRKEAISTGKTRYYTGKPCRLGHVSERFTKSAKCLDCHYMQNPIKGFYGKSKEHKKELQRQRARRWYLENHETVKERSKIWKTQNPDLLLASRKKEAEKRKSNASFKVKCFMRECLRRTMVNKTCTTERIIGYTKSELVAHIQSLFAGGMSWENYGEWEIDHIVPISWFLWAGVNDPKVINKLTNLQPLWSAENKKKWRPILVRS